MRTSRTRTSTVVRALAAAGALGLAIGACTVPPTPPPGSTPVTPPVTGSPPSDELFGRVWLVAEVAPAVPPPPSPTTGPPARNPSAAFGFAVLWPNRGCDDTSVDCQQGVVVGSTLACDSFRGTFQATGDRIRFRSLANPGATCGRPYEPMQRNFYAQLSAVTGYRLGGDALTLVDDSGGVRVRLQRMPA